MKESSAYLRALTEGINAIRQFGQGEEKKAAIRYKLFSDNLYVSFSYDEDNIASFGDAFISSIAFSRAYIINMLDNEIAIRGGISFCSDYSDDIIIFSKALVKAYDHETKIAKYPRVVIDQELITKIKTEGLETPGPITRRMLNNSILRDEYGVYFLNPSGLTVDFQQGTEGYSPEQLNHGFIVRHLKFVKSQTDKQDMASDEGKKIAEKYRWLCDLFLFMD